MDHAVRTCHLTKRYGDLFAVRDLNLEVPVGSVFGLIGPNGAGKSTTFSILATLLEPTEGSAEVLSVNTATHGHDVRLLIGYMPDVMGVYDNLRVREYLEFFASCYRIPRAKWDGLVDSLLELVDLGVKRDAMVDSLSRGMKQRLSLARALVHDPELLILDEPASGLDPRARFELRQLLVDLRQMGKTIIVSSHILSELEEMCTHVGVLEAGTLVASGEPADIARSLQAGRTIRVRLAGADSRTYTVANDEEQVALLQRLLVDEQLPVVEFVEEKRGLEELFLEVTKGVVQ